MNKALTGQDFLLHLDGYTHKHRRSDSWIERTYIYIYIEMYLYAEQIFASDGQEKFAHVSMEWSFLRQAPEEEMYRLFIAIL